MVVVLAPFICTSEIEVMIFIHYKINFKLHNSGRGLNQKLSIRKKHSLPKIMKTTEVVYRQTSAVKS